MSDLVLRPSGRDEDTRIRGLIAQSFPENPKTRAEITAWQYWDNPFGPTSTWVWEDAGEVVAHYTAYCVPVVLAGTRALAGIGVDAAVAPSHQGRRLWPPLARAVYDGCARNGVPITMCYPNAASTAGAVRAGLEPVCNLRTLVMAYDDRWLASRFHVPVPVARAARTAGFRVRATALTASEVTEPPDDLDELWRRVAHTVPNGIVRDGAWWRWRYAQHPDRPYRLFEVRRGRTLVGAAVTLVRDAFGGRFLNVLELLTADTDAARALSAAVRASAGDAVGAALIAVPGSPLEQTAVRAGFRGLPARLAPSRCCSVSSATTRPRRTRVPSPGRSPGATSTTSDRPPPPRTCNGTSTSGRSRPRCEGPVLGW
jgi:predicted N-acetyltransferase YhbS